MQEKCQQLTNQLDKQLKSVQSKYSTSTNSQKGNHKETTGTENKIIGEKLSIAKNIFYELGSALDSSVVNLIERLLSVQDDCYDQIYTQKSDFQYKFQSMEQNYQKALKDFDSVKTELEDLNRNEQETRS